MKSGRTPYLSLCLLRKVVFQITSNHNCVIGLSLKDHWKLFVGGKLLKGILNFCAEKAEKNYIALISILKKRVSCTIISLSTIRILEKRISRVKGKW